MSEQYQPKLSINSPLDYGLSVIQDATHSVMLSGPS